MVAKPPDKALPGDRKPAGAFLRYGAAFTILVAAFGVGICLGKLPFGRDRKEPLALLREESAGTAADAPRFESPAENAQAALPVPVRRSPRQRDTLSKQTAEPWDVVRHPGDGFRLRMRTVKRLSSSDTREGAPVTFVTEHAIRDASGGIVPAGSLVEGIIAKSSGGANAAAGRLVIKIHTIRVGTRLFTLDALPFAQDGDKDAGTIPEDVVVAKSKAPPPPRTSPPTLQENLHAAPAWMESGSESSTSTALLEWTNLSPKPTTAAKREAVLPKEAILEFELLQRPNCETIPAPPAAPQKRDRVDPFAKPVGKAARSSTA